MVSRIVFKDGSPRIEINGKLYGLSTELNQTASGQDDLTEFRALDDGKTYISFNGYWFKQPNNWSTSDAEAPAPVTELPTSPTDDGTYTLTCTVDDGTATLSWEAAEDAGT